MLDLLKSTMKNGIQVSKLDCEKLISIGSSKFGGQPHVPTNFEWPYFDGENYYVERKNRPLSFLAQFNLAEISPIDTDNLLPKQGMLYFFYELETMCWGYDKKEKDSFRVFYYDVDPSELVCATIPNDLKEEYIVPEMTIELKQVNSYPSLEELLDLNLISLIKFRENETWETYDMAIDELREVKQDEYGTFHQLLGYSHVQQNGLLMEMEIVDKYNSMNNIGVLPDRVIKRIKESAKQNDWIQLFQMGTITHDPFHMMFGDCGQIYFYIKKKDLLNRDFAKAWMILQCG